MKIPSMNPTTIMLNVTGQITIDTKSLEQLFHGLQIQPAETRIAKSTLQSPAESKSLSRLAYTAKESAQLLGVSPVTIYRLIQRGLLKSSGALRHKIIMRSEIERFLRETILV